MIMIQPYQDFQDRITSAINSEVWKLLIIDFTIDLEEKQDLSGRAEEVGSVDTQLRYYMLKVFHLV